jgi:hypothetical protein
MSKMWGKISFMAEARQQPSIGAELRSVLRGGAKDLWNNVVPAFPQSQHYVDEPGSPLNPTPQQITEDLGTVQGYYAMLDRYAARGRDQDQDRGMER